MLVGGAVSAVGFGVGAVARRWLAVLPRGTRVRFGPFEAAVAVVTFAGVVLAPVQRWPLVLWVGLLAVALSVIDVRHHRLPDAITLPAIPVTLLTAAASSVVWPESGSLVRAAATGMIVGGAFWALSALAPAAMGRGDAKLTFSLGAAMGYVSAAAVLTGLVLAFALGALAALTGVLARRLTMRSALPFGPALLLGCWLVLLRPDLFG